MDEKLKKALKSSKQGVWAILILSIVLNIYIAWNCVSVMEYLKSTWVNILYILSLVFGLVLYKKEKYIQGAELVQWTGLGNILITFINLIIAYFRTKVFTLNIPVIIGAILPIILVVEALKVLRLSEKDKRTNDVSILAILVIIGITVCNILTIM